MKYSIFIHWACTGLLLALFTSNLAQPNPGDVFREYAWFNEVDECDRALRVGGQLDYQLTGNAMPLNKEGKITPEFELVLDHAIKAELVVEKMLCHGSTTGLRVSVNGHTPLPVPESPHIRKPQAEYAHHYNAIVPLKLDLLKAGKGNHFEFAVDTAGHWWPQNLVYGMILRIYYEDTVVPQKYSICTPAKGDRIGLMSEVEFQHPEQEQVERIDLLGFYDGPDMEGDGLYRKWHYAYHKGKIYGHLATLELRKKSLVWNTEWIPDQQEPIKLAAFVHLKSGYSYMTQAVDELILDRPDYSVELCKPYQRPQHWFTRNGEFTERFQLKGDPDQATEARMLFRTWSPGYFNGIYINDFLVFIREGPHYAYYEHHIPIDPHLLKQGENILKTGKTPRYHGEMVHGVEVQWPGIMVLVKYDPKKQTEALPFKASKH